MKKHAELKNHGSISLDELAGSKIKALYF